MNTSIIIYVKSELREISVNKTYFKLKVSVNLKNLEPVTAYAKNDL